MDFGFVSLVHLVVVLLGCLLRVRIDWFAGCFDLVLDRHNIVLIVDFLWVGFGLMVVAGWECDFWGLTCWVLGIWFL